MSKFYFRRNSDQNIVLLICFLFKVGFALAVDVTIQRDNSITEDEFKGASLIQLSSQAKKYDGDFSLGKNSITYKNVPNGEYTAVIWNPVVMWADSPLWNHSFSLDSKKDITLTASRPKHRFTLSISSELKLAELFPRLEMVPCRIQTLDKPFAHRFAYQWVGFKPVENNQLTAIVALDPGDYILTIPYPCASEGWPPLAHFDCPYVAFPLTLTEAELTSGADLKVSIPVACKKK